MSEKELNNRIGIERNKFEIEHNIEGIKKNQEALIAMSAQVSRLRRMVWLVGILVIAIFILIFVNGMMVHWETGLDEYDNAVFDGSQGPGQILD